MTTPTRPRPDHDPDVTAPSPPGTARTRRVRPAPCGVRKAPKGVGRRGRSDGGEAAGSRCGPCYPNNVMLTAMTAEPVQVFVADRVHTMEPRYRLRITVALGPNR